jgi:integrase
MRADYLSAEEALALLEAIDREMSVLGKRDYALILGRLTCGLATDELMDLKWGDRRFSWRGNSTAWSPGSKCVTGCRW